MNKPPQNGFTLIELLTVIAIIGILAAIIIPVTNRVQETARTSVCASNLRAISMAQLSWADDNNGRLPAPASAGGPHRDDWIYWQGTDPRGSGHPHGDSVADSAIFDYLSGAMASEEILFCPSDRFLELIPNHPYPYSYVQNTFASSRPFSGGPTLMDGYIHRAPNPSGIVFMIEEGHAIEREFHGDIPYAFQQTWRNDGVARFDGNGKLAARHNRQGNASFLDGHVELVTGEFVSDTRNSGRPAFE